jgi:hypothetical protein
MPMDNQFDMKCPRCWSSSSIDVAATVWVRLTRDGTDADESGDGSHEWSGGSPAYCAACGHEGTAKEFEIGSCVRVEVIYDPDPDFSFLEQDDESTDEYRNPANHVQLEMLGYDASGKLMDSLSCMDFLMHSDDWKTGTFHHVSELQGCEHLAETAREMGLPE